MIKLKEERYKCPAEAEKARKQAWLWIQAMYTYPHIEFDLQVLKYFAFSERSVLVVASHAI